MLFAQNYPVWFMGMELAYEKIFCSRIYRIGDAISVGREKLEKDLSLTEGEAMRVESFLSSLQIDFSSDTYQWSQRRLSLPWWKDLFEPMYSLHFVPKLCSPPKH
jgi:hypothetical protein